ncbi:response regulator [Shewanella sp. TC10]|uniref:response regulator n=1 Tax=Shewanella sp. TC10 TaxID=1419739 RepID=UPI00129EAA47|nr:response regulator [Shewanella sp. TC10]
MSKNILIVDDSPSIRQMVEVTLKSANYQVTSAVDGQEALDVCKFNRFDFVLTDQNMPRMDGLTLIKSLRTMSAYQSVPIVVLTTEASNEIKTQGKAAGATGWMVKPFDPRKLLEVLTKVLG